MKSCPGLCNAQNWMAGWKESRKVLFRTALLAVSLFLTGALSKAPAQVASAGQQEGLTLFVGATASGQYLQYGERKMLGITGFVDADTRNHFGYTVEGSWIAFHKTADVNATTVAGGLRYRLHEGKFEPYAKVLAGIGEFNFPYDLATGGFLTATGGVGIDYNLSHRVRLRVADFEYTDWPQFGAVPNSTLGMSTMTVSTGIKVRIF